MDCENVDIYPVGWAELVGHKLESPRPAQPLTTKKEKRKGGSGGKKGGNKKRTTVANNSGIQSSNGSTTNVSPTTPASSVSPMGAIQSTPSLTSASLMQQNGSRKSRRVVSPVSDTSGVSTRTPTPPTISGAATAITATTSSASSSSPSSPSVLTASADLSEQSVVVSTTKSMATAATIGNVRPNTTQEADKEVGESTSAPASPTRVGTDDLSVEPMSMQDVGEKGESVSEEVKIIPRLVDSAGQASSMSRGKDINLNPSSWTVEDVAQFLQINECLSLADAFQEQVRYIATIFFLT